jgi:hypothetical protein
MALIAGLKGLIDNITKSAIGDESAVSRHALIGIGYV